MVRCSPTSRRLNKRFTFDPSCARRIWYSESPVFARLAPHSRRATGRSAKPAEAPTPPRRCLTPPHPPPASTGRTPSTAASGSPTRHTPPHPTFIRFPGTHRPDLIRRTGTHRRESRARRPPGSCSGYERVRARSQGAGTTHGVYLPPTPTFTWGGGRRSIAWSANLAVGRVGSAADGRDGTVERPCRPPHPIPTVASTPGIESSFPEPWWGMRNEAKRHADYRRTSPCHADASTGRVHLSLSPFSSEARVRSVSHSG